MRTRKDPRKGCPDKALSEVTTAWEGKKLNRVLMKVGEGGEFTFTGIFTTLCSEDAMPDSSVKISVCKSEKNTNLLLGLSSLKKCTLSITGQVSVLSEVYMGRMRLVVKIARDDTRVE